MFSQHVAPWLLQRHLQVSGYFRVRVVLRAGSWLLAPTGLGAPWGMATGRPDRSTAISTAWLQIPALPPQSPVKSPNT